MHERILYYNICYIYLLIYYIYITLCNYTSIIENGRLKNVINCNGR